MPTLAYFGAVFVSLFLVVDVVTNLPIFQSLTARYSIQERRAIARRALMVALAIQLLFVIFGNYIFGYLSIQLYSFSIAGGILLSIVAMEMLFGRKTRTEYQEKEQEEEKENITVVPLAIPLHTGPASIITGMILFAKADTLFMKAMFVLAAACVYLISMVILVKSDFIFRIFKPLGMKVITRVMGLILLTLAVQFVVNGVKDALK
jgi:multiple antibiotic resistance protein